MVIDAGDSDSIYLYVGSGQQNDVRSTGSTTKPENRGSPAGIVNTMTCRGAQKSLVTIVRGAYPAAVFFQETAVGASDGAGLSSMDLKLRTTFR